MKTLFVLLAFFTCTALMAQQKDSAVNKERDEKQIEADEKKAKKKLDDEDKMKDKQFRKAEIGEINRFRKEKGLPQLPEPK